MGVIEAVATIWPAALVVGAVAGVALAFTRAAVSEAVVRVAAHLYGSNTTERARCREEWLRYIEDMKASERPAEAGSLLWLGLREAIARRITTRDPKAAADQLGVQADDTRLVAERSEVARAFRDSLLPGRLPDIPGLELGARYRPAGNGLDVGGDFYDAFQADENWWVFAVGDISGHGIEAASLTGLARHTIRSAAMSGVMPSAVLGHLNRMLLQHTTEMAARHTDDASWTPRFCTVMLGAVQPVRDGVDIIICSAGHPLPLVRATDAVTPVGVPGTLLGVTEDVNLTDTVVHLAPGEAMVCYTNGLTDRHTGRRFFGEEGVVLAVLDGRSRHETPIEMAERVEATAVAFVDAEPTDDMAVLVLRASSPPERSGQ